MTIRLPLRNQQRGIVAHALISEQDAPAVLTHRWHLHNAGYAARGNNGGVVLLHRELMGLVPGDGLQVDHINRDRLDNRRENLRIVTHRENRQNMGAHRGSTSRHRGVSWKAARQCWRAEIGRYGERHYLGSFKREEDAARAVQEFLSAVDQPRSHALTGSATGADEGSVPNA